MQFESVQNPNIALGSGVGIQSAQLMAEKGVQTVLTGNCGPNAYQTFRAAGIQVIVGVSGSVSDAVEQFNRGDFSNTSEPNVASHFGMGVDRNFDAQPFDFTGIGDNMRRGYGRGMGAGRVGSYSQGMYPELSGFQQPAAESMSREQELALLKEQAKAIEIQTRETNARIQALEEGRSGSALMAEIDEEKCTGCLRCLSVCPTGTISMVEDIAKIDQSKCTGCGVCIPVCPGGAIVLKKT